MSPVCPYLLLDTVNEPTVAWHRHLQQLELLDQSVQHCWEIFGTIQLLSTVEDQEDQGGPGGPGGTRGDQGGPGDQVAWVQVPSHWIAMIGLGTVGLVNRLPPWNSASSTATSL